MEGPDFLFEGPNYLLEGPDHQRGPRLSYGGTRLSLGGARLSYRGARLSGGGARPSERGPTVLRRGPTVWNHVWIELRGPTITERGPTINRRGPTIREGPDYVRGARLSTEKKIALTTHTKIALTRLKIDIFWWFFRQNVRIDLLFPTRYHKMVFEWFFKKSIFSAAPAPGRRAAGGKKFFFQNVSPKVLIYSRKKTGAKNVFFTTFYIRLYPSGWIPPPSPINHPFCISLRKAPFIRITGIWEYDEKCNGSCGVLY